MKDIDSAIHIWAQSTNIDIGWIAIDTFTQLCKPRSGRVTKVILLEMTLQSLIPEEREYIKSCIHRPITYSRSKHRTIIKVYLESNYKKDSIAREIIARVAAESLLKYRNSQ